MESRRSRYMASLAAQRSPGCSTAVAAGILAQESPEFSQQVAQLTQAVQQAVSLAQQLRSKAAGRGTGSVIRDRIEGPLTDALGVLRRFN